MSDDGAYHGDGAARVRVGAVVLGRYRLDEQVAAGGMGVLWRATDTVLDGVVALKRVSFAHLATGQAQVTRDRTLREARLAAKLRGQPHVVSLYDIQVDEGDVWLVLEYVPSRSLGQILAERQTLPPADVARIGTDVADALAAAHSVGIQHRDVTPGNVLIGAEGTVKLTDFGIAHSVHDPRITQTGAVIGTIAYLAPEVAGGADSSAASDVYSLGATLYTALEGGAPYGYTANAVRMLHIVSTGVIRPPANAGPLQPALLRMLDPAPSARPDAATAREWLRRALEQANTAPAQPNPVAVPPAAPAQEPATGPLPVSHFPPGQPMVGSDSVWAGARHRPRQGTRYALLAAAAVVLVLAVVAAVALTGGGGSGAPRAQQGNQPGNQPGPTTSAPEKRAGPSIPPLPRRVPDITMPDDISKVDACVLMRTPALEQFGTVDVRRGSAMFGCGAKITAPDGGTASIGYEFSEPSDDKFTNKDATEVQNLGGESVYREPLERDGENISCQGQVALADNSAFYGTAYPTNGKKPPIDPCALIKVLNHATANTLASNGIVPQSGWAAKYPLAARNACRLLDDKTLSAIPRLDFASHYSSPANWACHWGKDPEDSKLPSVEVTFQLASKDDFASADETNRITVGGSVAYQTMADSEPEENACTIAVPQQQQPNMEGTFQVVQVRVTTPDPRQKRCGYARAVATKATTALS